MNVHVPSAVVTSFCAGSVGTTVVPSVFPVCSFGNNAFTSSGNSFPVVPDLNSWVTLCSSGFGSSSFVNFHVPVTCSSAPLIVAVSLSHASNVHVPLFTSSFTGVNSFGDGTDLPSARFSTVFGSWSFTPCGNSLGVPASFDGLNS